MTQDAVREVRAVLFDFGGVILDSPVDAFRVFEADAKLPHGFVSKLVTIAPDTNAWACAERGEIDADEFFRRMTEEAHAHGHVLDARALMGALIGGVRPEMVAVVKNLQPRYKVACLTNNMNVGHGSAMSATEERGAQVAEVMKLFPHVIESWKVGARKPEPRFFRHALEIVGVAPEHCVFLDDLGVNLKTAKAMGMQTIKVSEAARAIADLEAVLGHSVR